jgi:5-methylcytosine-specific restriction endonuclease McrA
MAFSEEMIQAVWEKGTVVSGVDSNIYRKDECGAWIEFKHHGDRNHDFGWEIDHIITQSEEGGDNLSNLRPLQWKNNASRQDDELVCKITANGMRNSEQI